jgi:hypothetical protein
MKLKRNIALRTGEEASSFVIRVNHYYCCTWSYCSCSAGLYKQFDCCVMSMTTTYNRLIQDLCSTFMNQNHRLNGPWEHYALWLICSILKRITARNVKWSVVFDKEVINRAPSASAEEVYWHVRVRRTMLQQSWKSGSIWCLLPETDYSAADIDCTEDTTNETSQALPLASSNVQISAAAPCFQTQLCFVIRKTSFVRSVIERGLAPFVSYVLSRLGWKSLQCGR